MTERTIRHVSFSYRVEAPDPMKPGETIFIEKKVAKGTTVDIPFEDDILRGEKFGAFETPRDESVEEVTSIRDLSDDELVAWIAEDHPKVSEVIDSAEGDPDLARRLLDAEDKATGGDSRKGVIEGLSAVLGSA
jgi:hypothetical protein